MCLAGYRFHQIQTLTTSLCVALQELSAAWPLSEVWEHLVTSDAWSCSEEKHNQLASTSCNSDQGCEVIVTLPKLITADQSRKKVS